MPFLKTFFLIKIVEWENLKDVPQTPFTLFKQIGESVFTIFQKK